MIQRRSYIDRALSEGAPIKLLVGPQRFGKSTLLSSIRDHLSEQEGSSSAHITLDLSIDNELHFSDCYELYDHLSSKAAEAKADNKKIYIYIDEIEKIDSWENVVSSLAMDFEAKIFITRSGKASVNSRNAAPAIEELFVGPFGLYDLYDELPSIEQTRDYLKNGGYAKSFSNEGERIRTYPITDALDSLMMRYVAAPYSIRDISLLNDILNYVAKSVGEIISAKSAADHLKMTRKKLSTESVYSYFEALEKSGLILRCPRYDLKSQKYLGTMEKIFFSDTSFSYALASSGMSKLLENAIFIELLKRGALLSTGKFGKRDPGFIADIGGRQFCVKTIRSDSVLRSDPFKHIPGAFERIAVIDDISTDSPEIDKSINKKVSADIIGAREILFGHKL